MATETTEAALYRALASTPQQLSEGLELVRSVLGKDARDLADMIEADRDEQIQPRLFEFRERLLALAALARIAFRQAGDVSADGETADADDGDDAPKPNGHAAHVDAP